MVFLITFFIPLDIGLYLLYILFRELNEVELVFVWYGVALWSSVVGFFDYF